MGTSREVVIKDDKSLKSVVDLRNIPDSQLTFGQLREKHLLVNPKQSIHLPIRDQTTSSVDSQQTYRVNYTVFREDGVSLKGSKVGMLGGPTKNVKEQILKELKNLPEDNWTIRTTMNLQGHIYTTTLLVLEDFQKIHMVIC